MIVGVRLPVSLRDELQTEAGQRGILLSDLLRDVLGRGWKDYRDYPPLIRVARTPEPVIPDRPPMEVGDDWKPCKHGGVPGLCKKGCR